MPTPSTNVIEPKLGVPNDVRNDSEEELVSTPKKDKAALNLFEMNNIKKDEDDNEDDKASLENGPQPKKIRREFRDEDGDKEHNPSKQLQRSQQQNNLTLEEFTDIVLASEGFEDKKGKSSVRVKPVVLAPRTYPVNHNIIGKYPTPSTSTPTKNNSGTTTTTAASNNNNTSSVVVSVRPRINTAPPTVSRAPALPPAKPMNVPMLVEEWFRRMKPPLREKDDEFEPRSRSCLNGCEGAINLSVKSKPVYLHPILESKNPSVTISSLSAPPSSSTTTPPTSYPRPPLSPPRLEIKKIPTPTIPKPTYHRYARSEEWDMADVIRDRAVRDLHLAHTKDMHGNYPIHMSVLMRKSSLVKRYCCVLQILNSNVDLINDDKYTPLHLAVLDNSLEIVDLLLSFGADPSIRDHRGNSCFHQAVAIQSPECLKLLVEHMRNKEDLDRFNDSGITALQLAVKKNDPACVHVLIKNGANLNIPENHKATLNLNDQKITLSERYLTATVSSRLN